MPYAPKQHFTKIFPGGAGLFPAGGQPERDMVKPIFAFRNMLKAIKNYQPFPNRQKTIITEILHFAKITAPVFESVPIS
jgi:hypothetical protein